MYIPALVGIGSGFIVLLAGSFLIGKLYAERQSPSTEQRIVPHKSVEKAATIEGEFEIDGNPDEIESRIDQSLRTLSLSSLLKGIERSGDTITLRLASYNFPDEVSYSISRGWSKPVKVSYRMDFTRQKQKFKRFSQLLLYLIAVPIATAIPWLLSYVFIRFPAQKIQLIQLVHLWHIWWPLFPYIIYRKSKNLSKAFFEGILKF